MRHPSHRHRQAVPETYSTDGPICPHCKAQYTPDEPHYFDESGYTEDECDGCGKPFKVSVYTQTSWTCEPIEDA